MEQWPLTAKKLQAAEDLVVEQLAASYIEPSNNPWNTPINVIKKKSDKWKNVTRFESYKRNYGRHGGPPVRPPFPSGYAFQYNVIVLQDCFFTIPLADQDCKRFAFSLPSANFTAL